MILDLTNATGERLFVLHLRKGCTVNGQRLEQGATVAFNYEDAGDTFVLQRDAREGPRIAYVHQCLADYFRRHGVIAGYIEMHPRFLVGLIDEARAHVYFAWDEAEKRVPTFMGIRIHETSSIHAVECGPLK